MFVKVKVGHLAATVIVSGVISPGRAVRQPPGDLYPPHRTERYQPPHSRLADSGEDLDLRPVF